MAAAMPNRPPSFSLNADGARGQARARRRYVHTLRDARAWASAYRPSGRVAIVSRDQSVRRRLSAAAEELAPGETAWLEIAGLGASERAVGQYIARLVEERNVDIVVMTVGDARFIASRLLARGTAVLAVPPAWRPGAGFTRIAVGYDGSEPADAAIEAARALTVARRGSALRVEVVHVDDSASAAGELDADVVSSRRTAVIEWWLAHVARPIAAPVGVVRRTGDPVTVLAELSSDFDLLVVGTHGRASLRRLVGRSVFEELIEATHGPVLIVPRSRRRRSESVLAAPAARLRTTTQSLRSAAWTLTGARGHQRHRAARRADQPNGHGPEQR